MVLDGLVGTATVTTQGPHRRLRHDAKSGDLKLATSGDLDLATSGDFFMATDTQLGEASDSLASQKVVDRGVVDVDALIGERAIHKREIEQALIFTSLLS